MPSFPKEIQTGILYIAVYSLPKIFFLSLLRFYIPVFFADCNGYIMAENLKVTAFLRVIHDYHCINHSYDRILYFEFRIQRTIKS